ncbi:GNAT family N-acetyltransferase [Virgibacillus sp. C22-A2]|uniref:GNAT family N-acetyltransferase n=1 Tax=Virgibacillus tibetensis TaxID=3042313 RepID=A0ABU6KJC3_9BACI|nr:GNAT family N-acetyltransferase [Virgibacillus sp. C22-A2]
MNKNIMITHLEEEDIDGRISLLYEFHVQQNLNHLSMTVDKSKLKDFYSDAVIEQQDNKRYYVIKTKSQKIIGYCWISDIDWINQSCELSISILPKYRIGFGFLAMVEMYNYLYNQLNMKSVINQILEGNNLLLKSAPKNALKRRMDSFTFGEYRASYLWNQTKEQYLELKRTKKEKLINLKSKFQSV